MRISNVDYAVVYVDPSKSTSGDGTTPAKAMNALPASASAFADNTCYLIRRTAETYVCTIPSGTNSSVQNLMIMGMPMSSDAKWELVPQEARTAWGSDAAQYACVKSTVTGNTLQLPSVRQFLLHRVYAFRDGINADGYLFRFYNSSDYTGCYSFEHCKFGSKGIDLDRSTYTGELTASRLKAYVYVYYARMVNLEDCTVNHAVTGNTTSAYGIYVYWADVLNVQDVRVYSAAWSDYGQHYALCLSGTYSKGIECNIVNVTQTVRLNGSASHVPLLLSVQGYVAMRVKGVKVVTGTPLSSVKPTSYQIDYPMLSFQSVYEVDVDGIDVTLSDCWNCKAPVLQFYRCYGPTYVPCASKTIRNVKVALADTAGIGSPISYAYASQSGESYAAVVLSFSSSDSQVYSKVTEVDGLVVRCPRGKALYAESVRMTDCEFEGSVHLSKCVADVRSLKTWFPGKALNVYDGTHVRVRKLECNTANPTYPYNEDPAVGTTLRDSQGNVFVDESNTALAPMATESSRATHPYIGIGCNNECAEGHFAFRTQNGVCDTWSVRRQGGGAAALKLSINSCSNPETMVLGRRPFSGMHILPSTAGRHVLKAHVAFKGFARPEELYRQFLLSVETGGRTYWSTVHGRWADDSASTWVNDSELTQLVLELPLDIAEVQPVDVRVYFSWYASGGFVYLDPDIELIRN